MVSNWIQNKVSNLVFYTSRVYFMVAHFVFWLINSFQKRKYVTPTTDPLLLLSATQAVKNISNRELTFSDLIESYIRRIEQVNDEINAVVLKLFSSAREHAKESRILFCGNLTLTTKIKEKPLFGVPFTMKDALEVEGENITCGLSYRKQTICDRSAEAVIRMKNAGAILLAVTNVPEMCLWVESVNTIYGRTKNPYDIRKMAGGSSGGEGALISSAGSVIGIGSDIGGSIRLPALLNGIFGIQATPGIVPIDGHLPEITGYKRDMLRIGPLCRYSEDLAVVLKVLAGDNADELHLDEPVSIGKLKIYYMEELTGNSMFPPLNDDMREALRNAVKFMEEKYDLIAQKIDLPLAKHVVDMFMVSLHEGSTDPALNKLMLCDKGTKGELNCSKEFWKFFAGKSNHTLPAIINGIVDSKKKFDFSAEDVKEVLYKRDRLKRQVNELLGDDGVLFFPTWPSTALFHNEPLSVPLSFAYTALWNVLSVPTVQCPIGFDSHGIPVGVQIIGNQFTERNLIAVAQSIEENFNGWVPPGSL